jgi:peptidoglycan/xylan/chitin deacetylase (PgdA/CDA1 family)
LAIGFPNRDGTSPFEKIVILAIILSLDHVCSGATMKRPFVYFILLVLLIGASCFGFSFLHFHRVQPKTEDKPIVEVHLVVLCYHHLTLNQKTPFTLRDTVFKKQLDVLAQNGFQFVSLQDVEAFYYRHKPLPAKSALITFDDGNLNTYTTAAPILRERKIPWVLFVYPTAIEAGHKRGFMNWQEVKALSNHGVTIGCHSYWHPFLTDYAKQKNPDQWLALQLKGSKDYIETQIGKPITAFALPFGLSDAKIDGALKAFGYQLVFNIENRHNDSRTNPLHLNRQLIVAGDTLASFEKRITLALPTGRTHLNEKTHFSRSNK